MNRCCEAAQQRFHITFELSRPEFVLTSSGLVSTVNDAIADMPPRYMKKAIFIGKEMRLWLKPLPLQIDPQHVPVHVVYKALQALCQILILPSQEVCLQFSTLLLFKLHSQSQVRSFSLLYLTVP